MSHEVAHYYFGGGPGWFNEGGANVVASYISTDGNLPDPVFPNYCAEQGLEHLQDWTDLGGGDLRDSCSYGMGAHFLLTLREVLGEEAWLSALRAFYLEYGRQLDRFSGGKDEDVYAVFIRHTPLFLVEKVNDVFRTFHGGPFISSGG